MDLRDEKHRERRPGESRGERVVEAIGLPKSPLDEVPRDELATTNVVVALLPFAALLLFPWVGETEIEGRTPRRA
jgi:hypothetical protein